MQTISHFIYRPKLCSGKRDLLPRCIAFLLDCLVLTSLSNLSKRETTRICSGNVFLSLFSRIQLEVHALKYPTIGMFGHTGQLTLAE